MVVLERVHRLLIEVNNAVHALEKGLSSWKMFGPGPNAFLNLMRSEHHS